MARLAAAYEGLEDPRSFGDEKALESYREGMLARSAPQADFLARRLGDEARVREVACGNGRLLVELARRGVLSDGLGVDIARSRIAFAEEWARAAGMSHLRFGVADALADELGSGWDAAVCITGALAYFEPIAAGSTAALLGRLRESLAPNGLLLLELYPHPEYLPLLAAAGGSIRLWKELGAEDPWRFYLSHLELDETGRVLSHEKTFVHRTTGEIDQGRSERLRLFTEDELGALLAEAGFSAVAFHEGWSDEDYAGGELMVVTARRA